MIPPPSISLSFSRLEERMFEFKISCPTTVFVLSSSNDDNYLPHSFCALPHPTMLAPPLLLPWPCCRRLGCLFLQESFRFLFFPFLSILLNRNHDSCPAVTLAGRPSSRNRSVWCLHRKLCRTSKKTLPPPPSLGIS